MIIVYLLTIVCPRIFNLTTDEEYIKKEANEQFDMRDESFDWLQYIAEILEMNNVPGM